MKKFVGDSSILYSLPSGLYKVEEIGLKEAQQYLVTRDWISIVEDEVIAKIMTYLTGIEILTGERVKLLLEGDKVLFLRIKAKIEDLCVKAEDLSKAYEPPLGLAIFLSSGGLRRREVMYLFETGRIAFAILERLK